MQVRPRLDLVSPFVISAEMRRLSRVLHSICFVVSKNLACALVRVCDRESHTIGHVDTYTLARLS